MRVKRESTCGVSWFQISITGTESNGPALFATSYLAQQEALAGLGRELVKEDANRLNPTKAMVLVFRKTGPRRCGAACHAGNGQGGRNACPPLIVQITSFNKSEFLSFAHFFSEKA
jgi:hypothetical protein